SVRSGSGARGAPTSTHGVCVSLLHEPLQTALSAASVQLYFLFQARDICWREVPPPQ
ncbi:hypothetical protein HGM15179_016455, partial [Zosterops borbonicus]